MSTKQSHGLVPAKTEPKKVAICIPSGDMVHADFAMALAAMAYRCSAFVQDGRQFTAIPIAMVNTKGSLIVNNRNKLVEEARNLGVDYILFVDSDIVVHPFTLRRLLEHDKDIVGATYIQREEPHRLLGRALDGRPLDEAIQGQPLDTTSLMEVSALPAGCLLVKMSVFDKMVVPYFQTPMHCDSLDRAPWIEGEDYFFCRMARAWKFEIFLDWVTSFALGHVGQRVNTIPTMQVEQEPANAIVH